MKPFQGIASIRDAAAPFAVAAFWAGMAVAANLYRPAYDWPYQTISVLLYRDRNPDGYLWAWAGLQLAGLAGLVWSFDAGRELQQSGGRPRPISSRLLQAGFLCMAGAVIPRRLLPWSKGHEAFALLSFVFLCSGITGRMCAAARRQTTERRDGGSRARVAAYAALPLVPPALAGATQAYLGLARPALPWVTPDWRVLGISPLLSFGLWEWLTSAAFSVCLLMIWHSGRHIDSVPR